MNRYKQSSGIKKLFAEPYGMSVAFIDESNDGYIYNPVNSTMVKIPDLPVTTTGIVWETYEPEKVIFALSNFSVSVLLLKIL